MKSNKEEEEEGTPVIRKKRRRRRIGGRGPQEGPGVSGVGFDFRVAGLVLRVPFVPGEGSMRQISERNTCNL